MEKMKMESIDLTTQNIEKIGELFPNCITETIDENGKPKKAINFEILKQMLSDDVIDGDEAYEFTWVGKKAAIVEANKSIQKTLRPSVAESKNWDNTENIYIKGDNLEALKLLQESYLGMVKMIYIDPPYNTGHDFIYPDSFIMDNEEYNEGTGYFDENGEVNFKRENGISAGKYHSDWCSMMYSRLLLTRNLMKEDGVIFISIDDNEVDNLSKICGEVFGEENFVCKFIWKAKLGKVGTTSIISSVHEYILCYAKNVKMTKFKMIRNESEGRKESLRQWGVADRREDRPSMYYPITIDGIEVYPIKEDGTDGRWRVGEQMAKQLLADGFLELGEKNGHYNIYRNFPAGESFTPYSSLLLDEIGTTAKGATMLKSLSLGKVFDFSKPVELIKHLAYLCTENNDLIMDFFSGSGTSAQAIMQLNSEDNGKRKYIMIQVKEPTDKKSEAYKNGYHNICEIGIERIKRAGDMINDKNPMIKQKLDTGVRVLEIDDSNMTDVYYNPSEYSQDLISSLESNIKPDRTDLDLLFGCLLDWGLPLSLPYSSEVIDGCTVHDYNDGDLIACFDENVPDSVVKAIAKKQPLRAVFRDSSFSDSPSKINVGEIFKLLAPDTRVKVI